MAASRTILTSTFVASIGIIVLLMSPLFVANAIESGELDDFFSLGGTSFETVIPYDTDADIGSDDLKEDNPSLIVSGNSILQCDIAATLTKRVFDGAATNLSTNLSHFGGGYYSYVHTDPGCDGDPFTIASTDFSAMVFVFEADKADIMMSEGVNFVVHLETITTFSHVELQFTTVETSTGRFVAPTVTVSDRLDNLDMDSGDLWSFPLTTQDRLLIGGSFPDTPAVGDRHAFTVFAFADHTDLPATSEVVVFDGETVKTRDGLLTGETKLLAFNIGYILIGGLLLVIASPWVAWTDLFGGRSARRDRRGQTNTLATIVIIGIALIAIMFIFAGGRFSGFFTASLLPLSLAVLGVSLVAMTSPGKTRPGLTLLLALTAGVIGWSVGVAIQANWLAYDKLYVVPFVEIASGQISGVSAFALSAFFVVVVQILGTLLAGFNATQTIATDDVVSLAQ